MSTEKKNNIPEINPNASVSEQIEQAELASKLLAVELAKQALEAQTLEIEERKYHIKDLKARVQEREIQEKQDKEDREHQGRTFAQQDATDLFRFKNCSHRKGGQVSPRDQKALSLGGDAAQHSVIKHQMINGDIWVRCLRCGMTWNPPVQSNFYFNPKGVSVAPADGVFSLARFEKAVEEYKRATMFPTNNSMSQSVQCRFFRFDPETGKQVDASDVYRENVASSNLR